MPSKRRCPRPRPRLCTLEKGDNGYGFHLHGEKGKSGQFIRLVEPDSPAETSGLRAGDRLVFVNGDDVENESHQQVVSRIRATAGPLELVVLDPETEQLLRKHNLKCLKEHVDLGVPLPFDSDEDDDDADAEADADADADAGMDPDPDQDPDQDAEADAEAEAEVDAGLRGGRRLAEPASPERGGTPEGNGGIHLRGADEPGGNSEEACVEPRPRLCVIRRDANGYGFNLHSERARPGQFIRAVDADSPAERAGLRPKDRIVQVNGMPVEGKTHSEVVAAIKAGGSETRLLVVDPDTDAFFSRCRVAPASDHVSGPLPEPVLNGGMEEKVNGRGAKEAERDSKLSVSPSPSNASSNTSLVTPTNTPPEGLMPESIPALSMSLQQVKELAHQKRSNKRAPPMDWTKKNELFSNL